MIPHWRNEFDPDGTDAFLSGFNELIKVARKYQTGIEARFAAVQPGSFSRSLI